MNEAIENGGIPKIDYSNMGYDVQSLERANELIQKAKDFFSVPTKASVIFAKTQKLLDFTRLKKENQEMVRKAVSAILTQTCNL